MLRLKDYTIWGCKGTRNLGYKISLRTLSCWSTAVFTLWFMSLYKKHKIMDEIFFQYSEEFFCVL